MHSVVAFSFLLGRAGLQDSVSLCNIPGCPRTCFVDQTGQSHREAMEPLETDAGNLSGNPQPCGDI